MNRLRPFFPDVESLVRSSRIVAGKSVAGAAKALERAATALPETLRELPALWKAGGGERRELRP